MKFTTSWDDGYADDLHVAELLNTYGCMGTFYVCPRGQHRQDMLTQDQIHDLSARHEIGAHTITHPRLTQIPESDARREIDESKQWVEERTGKPCALFCYPYGETNDRIAQMVQDAGFSGARTVEQFRFCNDDLFRLPTSLHVYPFPLRPIFNRRALSPLLTAWPHLRELGIPVASLRGWLPFSKAMFRSAHERKEPWFHLWGHSAEVEKYGMWQDLADFLDYVRTFPDIEMAYNSDLL